MSVSNHFQTIIKNYVLSKPDLIGIDVLKQFARDKNSSRDDVMRNLNCAFLVLLSGETHPVYSEALAYFAEYKTKDDYRDIVAFYEEGLLLITSEIDHEAGADPLLGNELSALHEILDLNNNDEKMLQTALQKILFPEGEINTANKDLEINTLREERTVTLSELNYNPLHDPVNELLLTSNVLLTIPTESTDIDSLRLNGARQQLKTTIAEQQKYWYDHPIPIGIKDSANEIMYGLTKLNEALQFEEDNGRKEKGTGLDCVLSVSTTHEGLHALSRDYLEGIFCDTGGLEHLAVYAFTEYDTKQLLDDVLLPLAAYYTIDADHMILRSIFGVDGEYGRHYSFLKAIAVLWKLVKNGSLKGTFKIDLDQVFPQEVLVAETGHSFFQHMRTPLWGARGTDAEGQKVNLSLLAGALVNESDIQHSLFTPDVPFPEKKRHADEVIFFSTLPQALSTEAEMMVRYKEGARFDGKTRCIQRIHVTGGTNGILIDALRDYRPFTPSFMGRAEDQSYILSVLFREHDKGLLRYVHKDGLIMRHDKHSFAVEAVESAKIGKLIGDYIRILYFSKYAEALPWERKQIKKAVGPFTGCFVSNLPYTVVFLRFCLRAARFFEDPENTGDGVEFVSIGARRLRQAFAFLADNGRQMARTYLDEKKGWDIYYTILDKLEEGIRKSDPAVRDLRDKARGIIEAVRLKI